MPRLRRPPPIDGVGASRIQLPAGSWGSLVEALCRLFPGVDEATWRQRFARGRVLDGQGRLASPESACSTGDEVHYYREVDHEPEPAEPEAVLHRDADLVVADKPHGMPVVPAGGVVRQTLLARLSRRLGCDDLVPLHRVDRDTAGLVLFSCNPASRSIYQRLFPERRIRKGYQAVAPALPGVVFPHERCSRIVRGEPFFRMREAPGEPNSRTRITPIHAQGDHWLYALAPQEGRKHQLRVHMAGLGAPILGDPIYAASDSSGDAHVPLQLLARTLAFEDPLQGGLREFRSDRTLVRAPAGNPIG